MESIESLCKTLEAEFGLTPIMAAEIECYALLSDSNAETMETFWAPIDVFLREAKYPLLRIEKERGDFQFEIVTNITTPGQLVQTLKAIRHEVEEQGARQKVEVSFAAKPRAGQASSGLHLHLHLADADGINAYHKTEEWTSDALRWSLGGLLANLPNDMKFFFPNDADYARLDDVDHVPKMAGWGVNNRYCALRIPAIEDPYHKRIEHRVPCANADPERAITAMLSGVLRGLREKIEPPAQEHGKPVIGLLQSLAVACGS